MSITTQSESDMIARIEQLELEIREVRRRLEHTATQNDKRVLDRQIGELKMEVNVLRTRIAPPPPRLSPR
jgi:predicted  nucleic acid-binding Zn-ribbon protein